ncbi:type II toxin-antitoxin system YafQ family toxin [Sulfurospirillum sp. T05]|uniref:Type II toxin-antitoxin system YafQ family toxin n=1 Tax=Sulfurospirillum tamanense TaxID=2813362 RepID=A0ABS2WVH3_9BACT|nr:type II toxin-antitoxin system YafQ family toxin [Sulfurospirillum tamanensis]MBN2965214.1 type II toxin-antitoxin system YafQ family toxin [Sulfurospirillum tamanensis]
MLEIKLEKSFQKDVARDKKSGKYTQEDFEILKEIITKLQVGGEIDKKHKRHPLTGNMVQFESLHVKNDWLLIFSVDENFLTLIMLGKHTQVYKKYK